MKQKLKSIDETIDYLRFIRSLYKTIGDGIAFLFINRFDLKPQNFKPSTGFITGKKGSRFERKCLRLARSNGVIAILNDLTNVLKYFDLTLIRGIDDWYPLELKSGRSRRPIQFEKGERLLNYLFNNTPSDLYERGHVMQRMEASSPPVDYAPTLNELIKEARVKSYVIRKVDPSLTAFVTYMYDAENLHEILSAQNFVQPLLFFVNQYKVNELGYYPLCLLLDSVDDYIDFLAGKLQITLILDLAPLQAAANEAGFYLEYIGEEIEHIKFTGINNSEMAFAVTYHYFSRIFIEFVLPSWFLNEEFRIAEKLKESFSPYRPI